MVGATVEQILHFYHVSLSRGANYIAIYGPDVCVFLVLALIIFLHPMSIICIVTSQPRWLLMLYINNIQPDLIPRNKKTKINKFKSLPF